MRAWCEDPTVGADGFDTPGQIGFESDGALDVGASFVLFIGSLASSQLAQRIRLDAGVAGGAESGGLGDTKYSM